MQLCEYIMDALTNIKVIAQLWVVQGFALTSRQQIHFAK